MGVKEEKIEVEGEVVEALPSTMFRVQLDGLDAAASQVAPVLVGLDNVAADLANAD